jgi:hypothetical protein
MLPSIAILPSQARKDISLELRLLVSPTLPQLFPRVFLKSMRNQARKNTLRNSMFLEQKSLRPWRSGAISILLS